MCWTAAVTVVACRVSVSMVSVSGAEVISGAPALSLPRWRGKKRKTETRGLPNSKIQIQKANPPGPKGRHGRVDMGGPSTPRSPGHIYHPPQELNATTIVTHRVFPLVGDLMPPPVRGEKRGTEWEMTLCVESCASPPKDSVGETFTAPHIARHVVLGAYSYDSRPVFDCHAQM